MQLEAARVLLKEIGDTISVRRAEAIAATALVVSALTLLVTLVFVVKEPFEHMLERRRSRRMALGWRELNPVAASARADDGRRESVDGVGS